MHHLIHVRLPLRFYVVEEDRHLALLHAHRTAGDAYLTLLMPYIAVAINGPADVPPQHADDQPFGARFDLSIRELAADLPGSELLPCEIAPPRPGMEALLSREWDQNTADLEDANDTTDGPFPGLRLYRVRANLDFTCLIDPQWPMHEEISDHIGEVLCEPTQVVRMERVRSPRQLLTAEEYWFPYGNTLLSVGAIARAEEMFTQGQS